MENSRNRDLDFFYAVLQKRARAIRSNGNNNINWELFWNEVELELFRKLPSDVTINIFSRLPIRSILNCKVVCKEWRNLIKSPELGNYQPDRRRCLIVFRDPPAFFESKFEFIPSPYKIEESNKSPMPVFRMGQLFESSPLVRSSVNGLILLLRRQWTETEQQQQQQQQHILLWVCNPITREYVTIPNPSETDFQLGLPYPPQHRRPSRPWDIELTDPRAPPQEYGNGYGVRHPRAPPEEYGNYNFGFGVSRTSNQYKVVWITQSECRVYTLGLGLGGQWRSIAISGPGLRYNKWNTECAFVDGNLYWLDPPEGKSQTEISCFDLETEDFTYFSAPPTRGDLHFECYRSLCAFDDRLCLCDVYGDEIEIWVMRGGGEWSKKVAVNEERLGRYKGRGCGYLFPIKYGENGLLLGTRCHESIHCYPNNNDGGGRSMKRIYPERLGFSAHDYPRAAVYIPNFLPLGTLFVDEDVRSF